jgi:hypothetical protein
MNKAEAKVKILTIMSRHMGMEKAIGMGELHEQVFGEPWRNRINDTRMIRALITELRYNGALIGEVRTREGGGYYQARSSHELSQFFSRRKKEALKKFDMIAKMQKISLDELLGQMRLNLSHGEAQR